MNLKTGDCFVTKNPMWLGKAITAVEQFWSKDGHAEYSHAGMMLDSEMTLESLWTVKSQKLFEGYKGEKVLIVRPGATASQKAYHIKKLQGVHGGQWYPFWRLGMHLFGPLGKIAVFDRLVCSELTAKYLMLLGIRPSYKGVNPDTLADEFHHWKNYEIIFEGEL